MKLFTQQRGMDQAKKAHQIAQRPLLPYLKPEFAPPRAVVAVVVVMFHVLASTPDLGVFFFFAFQHLRPFSQQLSG